MNSLILISPYKGEVLNQFFLVKSLLLGQFGASNTVSD
jgi:hypothetical protein